MRRASLDAALASDVKSECRTTLHPALLPPAEIIELAQALARMRVKNYALQVFRVQGCNDAGLNAVPTHGYPDQATLRQVAALFPRFTLRRA